VTDAQTETRGRLRVGAVLGLAAVVLAALAPVFGGPREAAGPGRVGVAELSSELASGEPFVDAVTVAEWIRDRRPVELVDVRDSSAFIRFSIPTARRVPFDGLVRVEPDTSRTLIVYDDGEGRAVRGWLLLRRTGHADVRILQGGVVGWIDGVISPVLPAGTAAERARYNRVADVSRYFGGMPRVGEPPVDSGRSAEDAVQLLSRRGCY
jgi:rhodanese-related sulfurtransferase